MSTDYGFDSYGRLATVTQGACVVSNAYLANSDLVRSLTVTSSNSTVLKTSKDWEFGYRLRGISSGLRKLYTISTLNQYTNITNEGYQPVTGVALATSAVSVNGSSTGVVRQGEYFAKELAVTNGSGPVWVDATVSVPGCAVAGGLPFPGYNQPLGYDADGNLTFDGIWAYEWDAEN